MEDSPGVAPHTTLSGSAGEMPTEDVRHTPDSKQLPVKALAAAAMLVLVQGGVSMLMRGAGDPPGIDGEQPATFAAGVVRPHPRSRRRRKNSRYLQHRNRLLNRNSLPLRLPLTGLHHRPLAVPR